MVGGRLPADRVVTAAATGLRSPWPALLTLAAGVVTGGGLTAASFAPSTAHAMVGGAISDSAGPGRDLLEAPCPYCTRLRRSLRDDREVVWVNVWVDGEANQEVRRHNRGNEYTPTALVGDQVLRKPNGEDVRSALSVAG